MCIRDSSIKEYLQAVVLPVHFHTTPIELPAGKLPLRLFGELFDTRLYPADLRIVVGKLVAFKAVSSTHLMTKVSKMTTMMLIV